MELRMSMNMRKKENGLSRAALKKSPRINEVIALVIPQPGQGIPVIALNGQKMGI